MPDKILPGYIQARELGYELYAYGGNKKTAMYAKGKLCLHVHADKTAELTSMYKLVQIKVENFSFPNKNFSIFEKQMLTVLEGVGE